MELASPILLPPSASDYPKVLHRCAEGGQLPTVTAWGSLSPLAGKLLGFFCSVRAPGAAILKTYDLARALRNAGLTLVGGFQSPMEREFLDFLLRGTAPVVICPARGISPMRIPKAWRGPMEQGRLLILSFCNAGTRRPTAATVAKRNALVAALADRLLVPYADPGGKIAQLCETALTQGKQVLTLPLPGNAHLVDIGATEFSTDDISTLRA